MTWLSITALAGLVTVLAGLAWPSARGWAAALLVAACAACFGYGLAARDTTVSLQVVAAHPAYRDNDIALREYPIETTSAKGWQWPAVLGGFFALWAVWLLASLGRGKPAPVLTAAVFTWSGLATVLWLEKLAAPAEIVGWQACEALCLLGTLACGLLSARIGLKARVFFAILILFASLVRLPLALFATWATQKRLGTHLDVHSIMFFVNPFLQTPVEVQAGSTEQIAYLIWVPELIVLPIFSFFVAGGLGFAVLMFVQHPAEPGNGKGNGNGNG